MFWSLIFRIGFVFLNFLLLVMRCEELYEYDCNSNDVRTQKFCKAELSSSTRLMPSSDSLYYSYYEEGLDSDVDSRYFKVSRFNKYADLRFITKGADETLLERQDIRSNLFSEWAAFTKDQRLLNWLAHDTLLGWYFQRRLLPWDHKMRVIVLNYDLVHYYSPFNGNLFKNRYLLDINPNSASRKPQKLNAVDARFIDTSNGYFIDIVSVSLNGTLFSSKGAWTLNANDVLPLRETKFQSASVWVPKDVTSVLKGEYSHERLTDVWYAPGVWEVRSPLRKGVNQYQKIKTSTGPSYRYNTTTHEWKAVVKTTNLNW